VARTQDAGRICTAGRHVAVRPGGPADAEALRSFITGLSQRTQYRRFFAGVAPPGGPLLRALCGAGNGADILVAACRCPACADRAPGGPIVGHAMAVDSVGADGIPAVEVGLVVADGSQRRGVGSALMRTLRPGRRARRPGAGNGRAAGQRGSAVDDRPALAGR
jgi:hypothetical protein